MLTYLFITSIAFSAGFGIACYIQYNRHPDTISEQDSANNIIPSSQIAQ